MLEAVKEGTRPLVTAIEGLQATIAADTAQRRNHTFTAVLTPSAPG